MYLSPYTDHVGQVAFTGALAGYAHILGDATREQAVLDYVVAHGINALSLYDLGTITADGTLSAALASFMARARALGVREIEAVGGTSLAVWDRIAALHSAAAPFDGMVTEIEFWNGGSVADVTAVLDHVRGLGLSAPGGTRFNLGVYLGWPSDPDLAVLAASADRLYLHVYVDRPELAYGYGLGRFQAVDAANFASGRAVEVVPIFSAEDAAWSAGPETFMGEWLAGNSLAAAEQTLIADWEGGLLAHTPLRGFQYYEYFFLRQYLP